jgi:hypothetical protein
LPTFQCIPRSPKVLFVGAKDAGFPPLAQWIISRFGALRDMRNEGCRYARISDFG